MIKIIAPFAICVCLANGCTSAPQKTSQSTRYSADGAVSAEIVDQPSQQRYEILPGEAYFRELPKRENAQPVYPENLLARQLHPVTVVARLIVNSAGVVEKANIVDPLPDQPEFSQAVLSAVQGWTFIPLMRVIGNKLEPLPFTQDYKFTFKQINGRAVVVQGSPQES